MKGVRWIIEGNRKKKDERKEINKNGEREKHKGRFTLRSDSQGSTIREEKSIHALQATRGYQNLGVSSNSTG